MTDDTPDWFTKWAATQGTTKKGPSISVLLVLLVGLPLLIFGIASTIKFIHFMNSPIINGQIPAWALLMIGVILLLILKRRQTHNRRVVSRQRCRQECWSNWTKSINKSACYDKRRRQY